MDIEFENVWGVESKREKSIAFWQETGQSRAFDISLRSKQAVFHVLNEKKLIGISTAEKVKITRFENNTFYYLRLMIHPKYRMPGLADKLATLTCDFLEEFSLKSKDEAVGIITLIEDKRIQNTKRATIYSATKLMYAGFTNNGAEIRLKYFSGVKI